MNKVAYQDRYPAALSFGSQRQVEIVLEEVCAGLPEEKARRLHKELWDHYCSAMDEWMSEGMEPTEAHVKVIEKLGWGTYLKIGELKALFDVQNAKLIHNMLYGVPCNFWEKYTRRQWVEYLAFFVVMVFLLPILGISLVAFSGMVILSFIFYAIASFFFRHAVMGSKTVRQRIKAYFVWESALISVFMGYTAVLSMLTVGELMPGEPFITPLVFFLVIVWHVKKRAGLYKIIVEKARDVGLLGDESIVECLGEKS